MIRITDKTLCTGCTACMNICPAQCIVMRRDREGFDYPVANPDLCTACGKCEDVCPVLNPRQDAEPVKTDPGKILSEGGVVYGPIFNDDMISGHTDTVDMETVRDMLSGKVVQSDPYGTFEEVKFYLDEGRKVLYIGRPCLLEGLDSYLGKDSGKPDKIRCGCRGAASPGLWEKYAKELKDKNMKPEEIMTDEKDPYMILWNQGMILRPSCYDCRFREGKALIMPKKRAEFFRGYHSAGNILKYMKRYVRFRPVHIWWALKGIFRH